MPSPKYLIKKKHRKLELEETKTEEDVIKPTLYGTMFSLRHESIMLFSQGRYNGKNYRLFYGVGTVYRVVKGEHQDLIYINFGIFKTQKPRLIVAYGNHARRQTLTLKRGQVCQVYGMCKTFMTEFELDGEKRKGIRMGLYATALNGWYVPTMMDIKKMPVNEDLVDPSESETKVQKQLEDVLNEFMTGGEE